MNTSSGTTLPSIHSLSLDLPSLGGGDPSRYAYQYQPYHYQRVPYLPPYAGTGAGYPGAAASVPALTASPPSSVPASLAPAAHQSSVVSPPPAPGPASTSPIASPYRETSVDSDAYHYRHRSVSDPIKDEEDEIGSATSGSPHQSPVLEAKDLKKNWKPRKKRQCPECKLYFSNLATHKSTHLKPTSRPHICKYCNRGFARPNDLFRHVKCHWKEIGSDKGQFKCPFKNLDVPPSTDSPPASTDHCCHNTGIFSRCDTFKNHLKAIHFQYPNGTKKDQRTKVVGKCRMCQQDFKNVDDWMSNHIEKNECPYAINVIKKEP